MIVQQQDANRFFLHGLCHRASGFDFLNVGHLTVSMRGCTLALPGFPPQTTYLSAICRFCSPSFGWFARQTAQKLR
jgi:hypothetical protein